MSRRTYKMPPIEEALCEFRFLPDSAWDLTIIGRLQQHEKIRSEYPGKPNEQRLIDLKVGSNGISHGLSTRQGLSKVQFPTADGTRLIGVGPDILSIHILRPYEKDNWEGFRDRISKSLTAYQEIANPKGIIRIGIRYINKITVASKNADPLKYFKCGPTLLQDLPITMNGFFCHIEHRYDDTVKLLLTHTKVQPPDENSSSFILDLDLIWEDSKEPRRISEVMSFVDDLRTREREAFEALITDTAREIFNGE